MKIRLFIVAIVFVALFSQLEAAARNFAGTGQGKVPYGDAGFEHGGDIPGYETRGGVTEQGRAFAVAVTALPGTFADTPEEAAKAHDAVAILEGRSFMYSDGVGDVPGGSIGGLVHAVANIAATALYALSFLARRRGDTNNLWCFDIQTCQ